MGEALLIIDVQNDFLPDGVLAVPGGDEVLPRINELIQSDRFDLIVATRDWHPLDHSSFRQQGGQWPAHCVRGTPGAEITASLARERIDVVIDKGDDRDLPGYSGFEGTRLAEILREHEIDWVTVVGLATDYCVRHSAHDALREKFQVAVDRRGIRGIDIEAGDSERAVTELAEAGASIG